MNPVDVPLAVLTLTFLLALIRSAIGPTLPDRVVATELMLVVLLGVIGLLAARSGDGHVLQVALVAALLQFVSTAALAHLLEREEQSDGMDR